MNKHFLQLRFSGAAREAPGFRKSRFHSPIVRYRSESSTLPASTMLGQFILGVAMVALFHGENTHLIPFFYRMFIARPSCFLNL